MGLHARCDEILAMIDAVIGPLEAVQADRARGPTAAAATTDRDSPAKEAAPRPER